ncbi:MAG: Gldg family protein [Pseudobacter sp.]|uniref:Gldg family protein n=1 Tax=Pseudobacter sp. TaxID=2045420 RepID=UPI003F7D8674
MQTIRRVAGTELRTLFYSPIAWFVLVVFLVQCGIVYYGLLDGIATQQEMGGVRARFISQLMGRVFVGRGALFSSIMQNLYLFIPLLTMGLISRETSSGTIRLLYSSPIKVRDIILGKYLAMVIYSLLMVSIVAIFVFQGMFQVKDVDRGMLMTSLIGFYLLLCTYSAIGLFMSCLTTYQIVAAVCTFVMIGILGYIGSVWQGIEFVRDITYFLSISGRTEKMLRGLLTTKDVIYFLVIIYIFVGLSILRIRSGMESKPAMVKLGRYFGVIAIGLFIGYISSRPALIGYYDATNIQANTIRPNVQQVIADLGDAPLEVHTYSNLIAGTGMLGGAEFHNTLLSTWENYQRFKKGHNIDMKKTITYYDSTLDNPWMMSGYEGKSLKEIAEHQAKVGGMNMKKVKTPEEMHKILDLRPELNRFVMQLKYKDRTTFLRIFDDQMMWPSETEIAAAFKRLQLARLPKVAFLTGNMERSIFKKSDREYMKLASAKTFRNSLLNQGFDVDTLSLEDRDVPADIDILVIGDPKQPFTEAAFARLKQYIERGGNLFITAEPMKDSPLQPLLKEIGVEILPGQIVQEDKDREPNQVMPEFTDYAAGLSKYLEELKKDTNGLKVDMKGVAALRYTNTGNFDIHPLLMSKPNYTWNRVKDLDPETMTNAVGGIRMIGGSGEFGGQEEDAPAASLKPAPAKNTVTPKPGTVTAGPSAPAVPGNNAMADRKKKIDSVRKVQTQPAAQTVKKVEVIQTSSPTAAVSVGRGGRRDFTGVVSFNPQDGDVKGPLPTALSLSRKVNGKEQRIIVAGDADFMRNGSMNQANAIFTNTLFNYLTYGEFPIDTWRKSREDNALTVSASHVSTMKLLFLWVLPAVLVAFATILLIRRKRK